MRKRLLSQAFFALFLYVAGLQTSKAKQADNCSSSCGSILNISNPFRFRGDPAHCGNHQYELSCEDNQTYLYLPKRKYVVLSIDYNIQTIRIIDYGLQSSNCFSLSPSLHSVIGDELVYGDPYCTVYEDGILTYVNCSVMMDPAMFIAVDSCFNASSWGYLYAIPPSTAYVSDLLPSCNVVAKATVSQPGLKRAKNGKEVHAMLMMGFELSWGIPLACLGCVIQNLRCYSFQGTRQSAYDPIMPSSCYDTNVNSCPFFSRCESSSSPRAPSYAAYVNIRSQIEREKREAVRSPI